MSNFVSNSLKSNSDFLVIFRKVSANFPQASLTFRPDAGSAALKVESLPMVTAAFRGLKVSHYTLDGIRFGFKTLRIYISAHFVSTSFKSFECLLTGMVREIEAFSKMKIKGVSEKFEFRREDLNA